MFSMQLKEVLNVIHLYDALMAKTTPKIWKRFRQLGITLDQFILDWMLSVFCRCSLDLEFAGRVWDCFLVEGIEFLFKTTLGILKYFENDMYKPFEDILKLLRKLPLDSVDRLFKVIKKVKIPTNFAKQIKELQS
eukprot:TRINITY_DN13332_c0_g1_i1.p1 TRINITY_DN13332_c0_g1~~TRINITY_DN13332_c0_g1_i1.p1  ORF type:complete len:135 (-),score=24.00 TRINITY_DN13332_c0_g1_i1:43-447(-)